MIHATTLQLKNKRKVGFLDKINVFIILLKKFDLFIKNNLNIQTIYKIYGY